MTFHDACSSLGSKDGTTTIHPHMNAMKKSADGCIFVHFHWTLKINRIKCRKKSFILESHPQCYNFLQCQCDIIIYFLLSASNHETQNKNIWFNDYFRLKLYILNLWLRSTMKNIFLLLSYAVISLRDNGIITINLKIKFINRKNKNIEFLAGLINFSKVTLMINTSKIPLVDKLSGQHNSHFFLFLQK